METEVLGIEMVDGPIERAAALIREGMTVAFPTETVYGLGANALDPGAVARIFAAKGRPADNPLIVHVAEPEEAEAIAIVPPAARLLMKAYWPGPLTLVMRKKEIVPDAVTAGLDTVAVRMPAHPVALMLIRASGVPIAAPSANRSGRPSPTTAAHVLTDMAGRIPLILDGGPCSVGIESTVLDVSRNPAVLLRPGDVTPAMIGKVLGSSVEIPAAMLRALPEGAAVRSPGLKHTHYAPRAPLTVVMGPPGAVAFHIQSRVEENSRKGISTGVLATAETVGRYDGDYVISLGSRSEPRQMARSLFSALRRMDEQGVDRIYAEGISPEGEGLAFMNRLLRAAGFTVIDVEAP